MAVLLAAVCASLVSACGSGRERTFVTGTYYNPASDKETAEVQEDAVSQVEEAAVTEEKLGTDQFLITGNDMQAQCLILTQLATGKQYMYNYSLVTRFLDKYGNRAAVSYFEPGRVICVGEKDIQGRLLEVQISSQVWEYPDITRYSIDEENGIFRIAETDYSYDEGLLVHSDGNRQKLSDLTELDTLRVIGFGRKILSVSVTTGHGELTLKNTALFKGSYIQVGRDIFTEITGDMTIEVPEGTYMVAVANNGYGGSKEVEIGRGEELVLDLDELKGEGPKTGRILFAVDVMGATLRIDGSMVDYSQPLSLRYGEHTLTVDAEGYDTLTKRLFVNSPEATVVIGLTGEDSVTANSAAGSSGTTGGATGGTAGSMAGSTAGTLAGTNGAGAGTGTGSSQTVTGGLTGDAELSAIIAGLLDDDDVTSDYLSTILDLITDAIRD